jgi:hypothetical protein
MYHQKIPCCCAGMSLCRIPNKTLVQILKTQRHSFSRVFGSLFPMLWFASWGHYGWMKTDHPIVPWPRSFTHELASQLLVVPFPPQGAWCESHAWGQDLYQQATGIGGSIWNTLTERTSLLQAVQIQLHPIAYFVHLVSEMKSVSLVSDGWPTINCLNLVNPRKDIEGTPETVAEGQKAHLKSGVWLNEIAPLKVDRWISLLKKDWFSESVWYRVLELYPADFHLISNKVLL